MHVAPDQITVTLDDGSTVECSPGTRVKELLKTPRSEEGFFYLGALVNNDAVSLSYPLEVDSTIHFLTMADSLGWHIYRNSLTFLLAKAAAITFPDAALHVEHSLGSGFYCNLIRDPARPITEDEIQRLETCMHDLIEQALPIVRRKVFYERALKYFEERGMHDKCNLLRFSNPPKVVIYRCDGFIDVAHGPLTDNTGHLNHFRLVPYAPGFVLQFPDPANPKDLPPFEKQPHLFQIFKEYKQWGQVLGVQTAGDLNKIIAEGRFEPFVRISEALHEKKLGQIADAVSQRKDARWIFIAGPSSSGKTTFAKRLSVHLKVNGLQPVLISVDNYFVERAQTPRDENGEYDFENIETIDLPLFHEHLQILDQGGEVELPVFNFENGSREYKGAKLQVTDNQIVLIEGIHSLNPRLSQGVPQDRIFKIYISALTQLNLDFSNRISTTDNRLVRRMVRDNTFRGNSALRTLQMWPNVRNGEKKWIFPFQQEADIAFNSALDYELAVLKPRVEPLLAEVKPWHPQYACARRLQTFLSEFIPGLSSPVPPTSLLREFIGQSSFA
jgi:uridine kinase